MSQDSGTKEIENEKSSNQKLEIRLSILKTKILALAKVIEKKDKRDQGLLNPHQSDNPSYQAFG